MSHPTSDIIHHEHSKPLLMLPGPEWPQFDFESMNESSHEHAVFTDHAIRTSSSVWDASLVLAKFLEKNAQSLALAGKRVIELGAGQGIPNIATAILGAITTVTDAPEAVPSLERVIQLNNSLNKRDDYTPISTRVLDWQEHPIWIKEQSWDVILASDVLWLYPLIEPFVTTLKALSDVSPHARIFISHQTRANRVDQRFKDLLTMAQLSLNEVPSSLLDVRFWKDNIHIWEITRMTDT
ncbi:putative methyltransferase-domain-containing protein [Syncephalis plumigaleata]|nr:putative methyltransferase-domain-containing protein [Syncephalis plumigaleata]